MSIESDAFRELAADIERAIDRLIEYVGERVRGVATVRDERIAGTVIRILSLDPSDTAAVPLNAVGEQWLVVGMGRGGGRWELDYDDAGMDFAEQLVDAAISGRVVETVGEEWTRLAVTFADGSEHDTMTVTGKMAGPFRPFLRRRRLRSGREIRYQPYGTRPED